MGEQFPAVDEGHDQEQVIIVLEGELHADHKWIMDGWKDGQLVGISRIFMEGDGEESRPF